MTTIQELGFNRQEGKDGRKGGAAGGGGGGGGKQGRQGGKRGRESFVVTCAHGGGGRLYVEAKSSPSTMIHVSSAQ